MIRKTRKSCKVFSLLLVSYKNELASYVAFKNVSLRKGFRFFIY